MYISIYIYIYIYIYIKKEIYRQSMAKIKIQVIAIYFFAESSKSELIWRGKGHFKVRLYSVISAPY